MKAIASTVHHSGVTSSSVSPFTSTAPSLGPGTATGTATDNTISIASSRTNGSTAAALHWLKAFLSSFRSSPSAPVRGPAPTASSPSSHDTPSHDHSTVHSHPRLALLDLRPTRQFLDAHFPHSTNFDGLNGAHGLRNRTNELPSVHSDAIGLGVVSSCATDLDAAVELLLKKGYADVTPLLYDDRFSADVAQHLCGRRSRPLTQNMVDDGSMAASDEQQYHVSRPLWLPAPVLRDLFPMISKHLLSSSSSSSTSSCSQMRSTSLSMGLTVLDVGAGSGRDASWLAYQGFQVTAVDRDVHLVQKAVDLYNYKPYHRYIQHQYNSNDGDKNSEPSNDTNSILGRGVYRSGGAVRGIMRTFGADLCADAQFLREHAASLLLVVRFLRQGVVQQLPHAVQPGGFVVYEHFLSGCERFSSGPRKPSQMLQRGELAHIFTAEKGFSVWLDEETSLADGRPMNRFVARRDR